VWDAVGHAIDRCRSRRAPVLLHLETVRLWGHAGSDAEHAYRDRAAIEATEARDPLLRTARQLLATGAATRAELRAIVAGVREHVAELADRAATPRVCAAPRRWSRRSLPVGTRRVWPRHAEEAAATADAADERTSGRRPSVASSRGTPRRPRGGPSRRT
jgi:2-oxoisovalerate dehydrogenase E1 component